MLLDDHDAQWKCRCIRRKGHGHCLVGQLVKEPTVHIHHVPMQWTEIIRLAKLEIDLAKTMLTDVRQIGLNWTGFHKIRLNLKNVSMITGVWICAEPCKTKPFFKDFNFVHLSSSRTSHNRFRVTFHFCYDVLSHCVHRCMYPPEVFLKKLPSTQRDFMQDRVLRM